MKETYDTQIKEKAREKVYSTLARIYGSSDPDNIRVLTLMGHETVEYDQIWEPLGIPPRNIVCLEKEEEAYRLLKQEADERGLDLEIKQKDAIEYLAETDEAFDIINLDFPNQFNIKNRNVLREIAGRGLLGRENGPRGDKGVLATWFLGSRETPMDRSWYDHLVSDFDYIDDLDGSGSEEKGLDYREHLNSRMIASIFLDGNLNLKPHPLVDCGLLEEEYVDSLLEKYVKIRERIKDELGFGPDEEGYEPLINMVKWLLEQYEEGSGESYSILPVLRLQEHSSKPATLFGDPRLSMGFLSTLFTAEESIKPVEGYIREVFNEEVDDTFWYELRRLSRSSKVGLEELYDGVEDAVFYYRLEPYVIDENRRFHYKSGKRNQSPMNVDINSFSRADFKSLKRLVDFELTDEGIEWDFSKLNHDFLQEEVLDWLEQWKIYRGRCVGDTLDPQDEITVGELNGSKKEGGASRDVSTDTSKDTGENSQLKEPSEGEKEEIYFWVGQPDITDQEIKEEYGITTMQLAGYKAAKKRRETS